MWVSKHASAQFWTRQDSLVGNSRVLLIYSPFLWLFLFSPSGVPRCVKTFTQHSAPIVAVRAGERFVAVASADNGLSLFHRPSSAAPDASRHGGADTPGGPRGPLGGPTPRARRSRGAAWG